MVLPLIPIIAGGAIAASSATLAWYYSLSNDDRESANVAVENVLTKSRSKLSREKVLVVLAQCSEILYGTDSLGTLIPGQLHETEKAAERVIRDSNDDFKRAMMLASKMRKNNE